MLFRTSTILFIFLCMSLSCFPDQLSGNETNWCHTIDDVYEVLKLYLVDIDAQNAKSICNDIVASIDEFRSINVAVDLRTNSLILAGPAYEVHLLEYNLKQKVLAFRDNEHKLLVLEGAHIDAQMLRVFVMILSHRPTSFHQSVFQSPHFLTRSL